MVLTVNELKMFTDLSVGTVIPWNVYSLGCLLSGKLDCGKPDYGHILTVGIF